MDLQRVTSRDGCSQAEIELRYGSIAARISLDKNAAVPRRILEVVSSKGRSVRLDDTDDPGRIDVDGAVAAPDGRFGSLPPSLTSQIAYFFAATSVAMDLLGDVYLYRDPAFPQRPRADRYIIGRLSADRSLEMVVREFLSSGPEIEPLPNDTWLMDAFDHVVTKAMWQGQEDERAESGAKPVAVNYWQGLFGA